MLYTRSPFSVISRIIRTTDDGRIECECFRLPGGDMTVLIDSNEISEWKRGDLARALLEPSQYSMSRHELLWWVDELRPRR